MIQADAIIVGGGSSGLQAGLTLGRMRFDVLVIDSGEPANAPAHAIGGLLGAHQTAPLELLARGREQLAELPTVRILDGEVTRLSGERRVELDDGTAYEARSVVLATGCTYAVPDVPGIAELWGNYVIHCPFCHGWEARDSRIGLLSAGPEHAGHIVPMISRLSGDIEVFDEITAVNSRDGKLHSVEMPDGTEVERDVLFVAAPPAPRDVSFADLGLERTDAGVIAIDEFGRTSVDGIYAAGDLVTVAPAVSQAIATGQRAAVGVTRDLNA
jgi:thioredoxin reductase